MAKWDAALYGEKILKKTSLDQMYVSDLRPLAIKLDPNLLDTYVEQYKLAPKIIIQSCGVAVFGAEPELELTSPRISIQRQI